MILSSKAIHQSPVNFLARKVIFLYRFSHKEAGDKLSSWRFDRKQGNAANQELHNSKIQAQTKQSPMMYFQEDISFKGLCSLILALWSWSQSPLQKALLIS